MPNLDNLSAETLAAVRRSILARDPARRREAVLGALSDLWCEADPSGRPPRTQTVAERTGLTKHEVGNTVRQLVREGALIAMGETGGRLFIPAELHAEAMAPEGVPLKDKPSAARAREGKRAQGMRKTGAKRRGRR